MVWIVYVCIFRHNEINEGNADTCYNMDEHWKHHKWKKPYRKGISVVDNLDVIETVEFL